MSQALVRYSKILEIVGDIVKVQVADTGINQELKIRLGDLALVEQCNGDALRGQVINLDRDVVSLQIFAGTNGVSTDATVTFLGHPMKTVYSGNILGRVFNGVGEPIDGNAMFRWIHAISPVVLIASIAALAWLGQAGFPLGADAPADPVPDCVFIPIDVPPPGPPPILVQQPYDPTGIWAMDLSSMAGDIDDSMLEMVQVELTFFPDGSGTMMLFANGMMEQNIKAFTWESKGRDEIVLHVDGNPAEGRWIDENHIVVTADDISVSLYRN